MPSKTEKQKKFFSAVMGAKKGQKGVSGEAKKVAKEMPKKKIEEFLKTEEEDEQSVVKKMKKGGGKATFEGPNVKERRHFAPPVQTHKNKKGKGSYDRRNPNPFDEDDESGGVNIFDYVEQKQNDGYGVALINDNDQIITPYIDPNDYPDIELSGSGSAPRVINDPSKNGWFVMIHSGILETEPEKMGYKKYTSFEENEEKACWKGYKKRGTIEKGGKTVNNCVKESTSILKFLEAIMTKEHSNAHKHLKDAINQKIQTKISQEIEKPLF